MLFGPFTRSLYDYHYKLVNTMMCENKRIFLVVDGSFYPNIRPMLNKAGLVHRALYKSTGAGDVAAGGPRLINPYQGLPDPLLMQKRMMGENGEACSPAGLSERLAKDVAEAVAAGDPTGNGLLPYDNYADHYMALNRIEHLIRLLDGNLQGVIAWCGEALTSDKLYRHLRTLNQIMMPRNENATQHARGYAVLHDDNMALSTFRHADGNVIAQLVRVLQPRQFDCFLGSAERVYFEPSGFWESGANEFGRKGKAGQVATRTLHLTPQNLSDIANIRLEAYDKLFFDLLLEEFPHLHSIHERDLHKKITNARKAATHRYGLKAFGDLHDFLRVAVGKEEQSKHDSYTASLLLRDDVFVDDKIFILRNRYSLGVPTWR